MSAATTGGPQITRENIEKMTRRPATLKARAEALERAAAQCMRLYPWPALAESFLADAAALRADLKKGG